MPEKSKEKGEVAKDDEKDGLKKPLTRAELDKIKAKVALLEEDNLQYIHLFRTTNGWWKVAGPSALYYNYELLPRLASNRVANLRADNDKVYALPEGVVSIPDAKVFERDMLKLGVKKLKRSTETLMVFKMSQKYTKAELRELRRRAAIYKKLIREAVVPKMVYAGLLSEIEDVMRITYRRMRKDSSEVREYLTMEYAARAKEMYRKLVGLGRGIGDPLKVFSVLVAAVEMLVIELMPIAELGIWPEKTCLDLSERLTKLDMGLRNEYGRLRRKQNGLNR